jgi:transcriptional regulator with XRE-family HTH domain
MSSGNTLRYSRRRAGLTQRDLAARSGVPQATIARIESGRSEPRFALLQLLLRECGQHLAVENRPGVGIDRSLIREMLKLTPRERIERAAEEARNLDALEGALVASRAKSRSPDQAG